MCRSDHFIAWLQAKCPQGDVDRIRAVCARDATFYAKRSRPCLLKSVHVASANVCRLGNDLCNRSIDLILDRQVLRVQVNERDFHGTGQKSEVRIKGG